MKHIQRLILSLIIISAFNTASAQLKVRVIDKATLMPVPKAGVYFRTNDPVLTDESGEVNYEKKPPVDSGLVRHPNYNPEIFIAVRGQSEVTVYLTEKAIAVDEIVVSASRFEEKKKDVAQQITLLTRSNIQFLSQQNTGDLLQQTGHVFIQKSQQGGSSPVMRGFEASRVLIVVDGVRMNNAIYRAGHLQNVIRIDNNALDRTEIVLGPGSVIYGSDAFGGVMHFHTRRPSLKTGSSGNVMLRYGNVNNERTGHIDFNLSDGKIASFTSLTYSAFGDMWQGANRDAKWDSLGYRSFYVERINDKDVMVNNSQPNKQVGSAYDQFDLMQKILYQQSEKVNHILNFQFSNSSIVPRYDRLTEKSGANPRYAEWHYGPEQRLFLAYTLELKKAIRYYDQLRITTAFQDVSESRHTRNFNNPLRTSRYENVKLGSVNIDAAKQYKKIEFRYGAEGTYNVVNSIAETRDVNTKARGAASTRYPDGGSTFGTAAVYATGSMEMSERFILHAGARYNYVGLQANLDDKSFFPFPYSTITQNYQALNGSLGYVYRPVRNFKFSLLLSTAFRAPNVDDVAKVFESRAGQLIVPNADLGPEKSFNVDIGLSYQLARYLKLEVNGYFTAVNDLVNLNAAKFNGQDSVLYQGQMSKVMTLDNRDRAEIFGISAGLYSDINEVFSVSSTLNYTKGTIIELTGDMPLDHVAPMFGRTAITGKWKKIKAEFYMLYAAKKDISDYRLGAEDNEQYALPTGMPGWMTYNIRMNYAFNPRLQGMIAIENLTDTYYRTFASGFSGAGRNVSLTLRAVF